MHAHADKTSENKNNTAAESLPKQESSGELDFQFTDNRPEAIVQRKLQEMVNNSPRANQLKVWVDMANNSPQSQRAVQLQAMANNSSSPRPAPIQKKENNTGLPDNLKTGIENLGGNSMDDVQVHYNSNKPVDLPAHAYAQGTDIHLAPGQEKHLPHEAWHVAQQKQGRVKSTMQMKGKVNVNDDPGLENEADEMGAKAFQFVHNPETVIQHKLLVMTTRSQVFQLARKGIAEKNEEPDKWYTDDGKGPFHSEFGATRQEKADKGILPATSQSLQSTAWDGVNNTTLHFKGGLTCDLTMQEVIGGILEIAGDAYRMRIDGVVQLYADKSGVTAHVHVDTGVGGGLRYRGNRTEDEGRTPQNLTESIKRLPGYQQVKRQALELKEHYKANKDPSVPRNEALNFLERKERNDGTDMYVSSMADAGARNWNIGDLMVTSGAIYRWIKPHKAGDPVYAGDLTLVRLQGG